MLYLLQNRIKTVGKWAIGYTLVATVSGVVMLIFFNNSNYPTDQIAFVIATPIMIVVFVFHILKYFLSDTFNNKKEVSEAKDARTDILMLVIFLFLVCSVIFGSILLTSGMVYYLAGLKWAFKVAIYNLALPSFIVALISLALLVIAVMRAISSTGTQHRSTKYK